MALIKSSGEPFFVRDSEHRYVLVNDAFCRMMGVASEQLLGETGAEFFPEEKLKELLDSDDLVLKTGRPDTREIELKKKSSDEIRLVIVTKTLFTNKAGSRFIAGSLRDITEQKRAEQIMLQAKEEWERTFNTVPDLVAIIDNDQRIVHANKAMADRVGLTPGQCVGRRCFELFHGCEQPPAYCPHPLTCADGKEHDAEVYEKHLGADFLISTNPILDAHGRIAGVVEVARDISVLKLHEKELQEAAKLRSDLISMINHEYANALTSMKLALALLTGSESVAQDQTRGHSYEVLDRAIERLRAYTTNFLNLHRLESGKFALNLRPTAVRAVVLDALVTLRPLAEAKQLRLDIETYFPEALPVAVRADQYCLSLIVSNLVTNAVKYTPNGGSVTICITLEGTSPSRVMLAVEDTGIGMSAEDLEKIKSGFYRAPEGQELAKGFGVGLMVVNQLLEKHGSFLEIESEPGKGSRFSFRLPLWSGTQAPKLPPRP
jgi:PAS domain S-box-containing protein